MIKINSGRFFEDLKKQGEIGWKEGAGLFRESYGEAFYDVRDFIRSRMEEAGLATWIDPVGNLFGRLEGVDKEAKTILSGSHLDSVTAGGILDGALGVISSLEAVRAIKDCGAKLKHPIEVVAFAAEEGGPLGGTFGSRAFAGQVKAMPAQQALNDVGLTNEDVQKARGKLEKYCAFLEVHIEQGPILWKRKIPVGIPTAIVGITRYMCNVKGVANHAGTTPMNERQDAVYDATGIIHKWLEYMRAREGIVCNCGYVEVAPNHPAIVPGEVNFSVEIRSDQEEKIADAVEKLSQILSEKRDCRVAAELSVQKGPVKLDRTIIEAIQAVCDEFRIVALQMPSWASHDASPLAQVMPAGMIFVPSINGISHQKAESTDDEDLLRGVTVLANTIVKYDAITETG
jgi:hydantoinase/carbamoylase family amidase